MLSFVEKHLKNLNLPKRCLFILCISYLSEKELNQQVCLIKYVGNEISHNNRKKNKKEEREEHKHNPTLKMFLKLTLVINYHKLSLLPLVVRH